jgi:hypothetical protein
MIVFPSSLPPSGILSNQQMDYDINFGTLIRRKNAYPVDGVPLSVGLACLLRQFHPVVTRKLLSYLGQFVRTTMQSLFVDVDNKAVEVPKEVVNTLIFIEQLCLHAKIPRSIMYAFVPAYIFDRMKLPTEGKN